MLYTTKKVDFAVEINEYGQPYVNPYFGCTAGCPFCYWLSIPGWEGKIDIRLNIAEQLDRYCQEREAERPRLYMGSYCDPYMEEVEAEYQLTRRCLEVAARRRFPLTLCTSARSELILRDVDLLRQIPGLTVVAELCRLDQTERLRTTWASAWPTSSPAPGCGWRPPLHLSCQGSRTSPPCGRDWRSTSRCTST